MAEDFLNWLENKVKDYKSMSDEERSLVDVRKKKMDKIRAIYKQKREEEYSRSRLALDKISEEEQTELASVPEIEFDSKTMVAVREEIWDAQAKFLEKLKINHDKMCELLQKETGFRWKSKEIVGNERYGIYGPIFHGYGVALVREQMPEFYIDKINKNSRDVRNRDGMIIGASGACCGSGDSEALRDKCQNEANQFNWLIVYLINNNLSLGESSKKWDFGVNNDLVNTVLNKYVASQSFNSETFGVSSEEGMGMN